MCRHPAESKILAPWWIGAPTSFNDRFLCSLHVVQIAVYRIGIALKEKIRYCRDDVGVNQVVICIYNSDKLASGNSDAFVLGIIHTRIRFRNVVRQSVGVPVNDRSGTI